MEVALLKNRSSVGKISNEETCRMSTDTDHLSEKMSSTKQELVA